MKRGGWLAAVLLAGCASTSVDTTGTGAGQRLCQDSGEKLSALVLWSARWRPEQKDALEREAAVYRGIERYFDRSSCFTRTEIRAGDAPPADRAAYDRVVLVTVRELGPVVRLFASPALVDGGTEVVLEARVFGRAAAPLADVRTHWQNGGPWVLKGTASLEHDMYAALDAVFRQVLY
jgi:hypothetical protein